MDKLASYNAVQVAVRQAGGVRRCARLLRVTERLVYLWMKRGHMRGVAAERVLLLERLSGVTAENLIGRQAPSRSRRC